MEKADTNNKKISAILLMVSVLMLFYTFYSQVQIDKKIESVKERYTMLQNQEGEWGILEGTYHTEGYYCVWTKDRTPNDIATTVEHEKCHALIDENNNHYCGATNDNNNN